MISRILSVLLFLVVVVIIFSTGRFDIGVIEDTNDPNFPSYLDPCATEVFDVNDVVLSFSDPTPRDIVINDGNDTIYLYDSNGVLTIECEDGAFRDSNEVIIFAYKMLKRWALSSEVDVSSVVITEGNRWQD